MLDLKPVMYALTCLGALCVLLIWGISSLFSSGSIESQTPITPTVKYKLVDNHLDSVYVYTPPKRGFFHRITSKD